jgi:hypothetical protein
VSLPPHGTDPIVLLRVMLRRDVSVYVRWTSMVRPMHVSGSIETV